MIKMDKEKEIKRFEAKTEAKIINALDKIFLQTNNTTEEDAVNNNCNIVTDPAHICMCIGKTEEAKRTMSRFVNKEIIPKIPNLNINNAGLSRYSTEYIVLIINVLKLTDDHIIFNLGTDTPAIISNEDFEFWIAPRLEDL